MARLVSHALLRHSTAPSCTSIKSSPLISSSSLFLSHRNRSTRSGKGQLIEIDLDSSSASSSSSSSDSNFDVLTLKKLEDIVQGFVVKQHTPDWLPFMPGSSFWVPPRRNAPVKVFNFSSKVEDTISEEESLSLNSSRGWPCSSFFTTDVGPAKPVDEKVDSEVGDPGEMELEVEVKIKMPTETPSHSGDEEK